jgi:hypothetical protein
MKPIARVHGAVIVSCIEFTRAAPSDVADELLSQGCMSEDQPITTDHYQSLKDRLDSLEQSLIRLTACMALELGANTAKSIINEIKRDCK